MSQNGYWDRELLCEQHERQSGAGDQYAVQFARTFRDIGEQTISGSLTVPNPKAEALSFFAHSTVWKTVVSKYGRKHSLTLGPYEKQIRDRVFYNGKTDLPFLVSQFRLRLGDDIARIAIPPYRLRLLERWVWTFVTGGLQFFLKTDQQPWPAGIEPFLGNGNDPVILAEGANLDVRQAKTLEPLFDRMSRRREPE